MKLNRKVTRLAASVLATAMFACATALPAMAEEPAEVVTGASFSIDKVITKEAGVYTPVTNFTFKITPVTPTGTETMNDIVVEEGKLDAFPTDVLVDSDNDQTNDCAELTVSFTATERDNPDNLGRTSVSKTTNPVTLSVSPFTHAGVYKYEIQEEAGIYEGMDYDTAPKYLYVYVGYVNQAAEQAGSLSILNTVVVNDQDTSYANDKTNNITNNYGTGTVENQLADLTIEKTVTGTQGDKETDFHFTIKIDGDANEKYQASIFTMNDEGAYPATASETQELMSGEAATIAIHHGEKIVIKGLSTNDTYTVYENEADQLGYSTTVTGTNAKDDVQNQVSIGGGKTVNDHVSGNLQDPSNATAVVDKHIIYKNDRNSVTPTGVIMNVAPYVLMVVIAAAGCFVFLRKRRDD